MLRVGITGGIGSGKSTVCALFETLGVPVMYADSEARWLMEHDVPLVAALKNLLGEEAYANGQLQRAFVASQVFGNPEKLAQLNALVHPAVRQHGDAWFARQAGAYAIKEAALFFESGSAVQMDVMVGVYAPDALRIQRVVAREKASVAEVEARMARQMPQEEKMAKCSHVIVNDDVQAVLPQVLTLHHLFTSLPEPSSEN
jgi:dephospho-CoA kinase